MKRYERGADGVVYEHTSDGCTYMTVDGRRHLIGVDVAIPAAHYHMDSRGRVSPLDAPIAETDFLMRTLFGKPTKKEKKKPRNTDDEENAMGPETINKLKELASRNAVVQTGAAVTGPFGSTVQGRAVRFYAEPMVVVRDANGDEHMVPAKYVAEVSDEALKAYLLTEREFKAARREADARQAVDELRELLSEAADETVIGRLRVPEHVQAALVRLAEEDEPYDGKLPHDGEQIVTLKHGTLLYDEKED